MTSDRPDDSAPRRRSRRLLVLAAIVVVILIVVAVAWPSRYTSVVYAPVSTTTTVPAPPPTAAPNGSTYHVEATGDAGGDGSEENPWGQLTVAFESLLPGDVLIVGGGTYRENVRPFVRKATADEPIVVRAATGERPVVEGLLWLEDADHWSISGINVTWAEGNDNDQHMVKFTGGESWEFTDAEVWGARSYAAVLVAGRPRDFRLANLYVHDTYPSNDDNQDHLVYLNSGDGGGVVERCLFVNSPNGRGIKIGGADSDSDPVANIVIRYNTFYDNLGPSNLQLSYGASNIRIERNIFVKPSEGSASVTTFRFDGDGITVVDNIAWEATKVVDGSVEGFEAVRNRLVDPIFADPANGDFRPTNPAAYDYGYLAP